MSNTKEQAVLDPNAKLGFMERFAYGLGDYSANLVCSAISSFLLVYYVSVVGADPAVAASILAISKIFDGISDLLMGRIVDKTHSKYGKARPWILWMCFPLAISTVLMFSVPSNASDKVKLIYMFLTYNLCSTVFYTAINVPYATLQGLMTTNQYERGLLGNFRMLLATFGTMTINTVVLKLCGYFGNGDQYSQHGWTLTFVVLMIAFILLNFVTFRFCKERVVDNNAGESGNDKGPSVRECLKSLFSNKYWLIMVLFLFVLYFMMATFFGSAFYFAQFVVNNEGAYSAIANSLSLAQVGMMFLTPFIIKKLGKRITALIGMSAAALAFLFTALAGQNVTLVICSNILKGAAFGCAAATMFGLLQDSITYGQWYTGVQATGMGNAASSFCMKIGSGIGTAVLGWILKAGGFDSALSVQSSGAVTSINVACIWIPLLTCVIGALCMVFFDLDKHYDTAVADLTAGKWRCSEQ